MGTYCTFSQSLGLQQIGSLSGIALQASGPSLSHSIGAVASGILHQQDVRLDQGMYVPCDLKCRTIPDNIESLYSHPTLNIYPNPTSSMIYVEGDNREIERIALYDAFGRQLLNGPIQNQQLSLESFPSGLYFLRIYGQEGILTFVGKVLKE